MSLLGFEAELLFALSALSAHQHAEILWESQVSGNNTLLPRPFIIMTNTAIILSCRLQSGQCFSVTDIPDQIHPCKMRLIYPQKHARLRPFWCVREIFRPLACNYLQINHKRCRLRENSDKMCCSAVEQNRGIETRLAVLKTLKNSSLCVNGQRCPSLFTPPQQSSGSHSIPLSFWQTDLGSFYLWAPLSGRGKCFIDAHFLCITIDEPQREMKNVSF